MVQSFNRAFSESGVHAGLISVEGVVAPENKNRNPINIAEKTWDLCMQEKGSFDLDVDIVDPEYKEKRKGELASYLGQQK